MKKIASIILVLCLSLSLLGCGGGDKPTATDGGQPTNEQQQAEQQTVEFKEYEVDAKGKEAIYLVDQEVSPEEVQAFLEEKAEKYTYVYVLDNEKYINDGYTVGAVINGKVNVIEKDWSKRPSEEQVDLWAEYNKAWADSGGKFDLDQLYNDVKDKYGIESPDDFAAQIDTVYNWVNNTEKYDLGVRTYEEMKEELQGQ